MIEHRHETKHGAATYHYTFDFNNIKIVRNKEITTWKYMKIYTFKNPTLQIKKLSMLTISVTITV